MHLCAAAIYRPSSQICATAAKGIACAELSLCALIALHLCFNSGAGAWVRSYLHYSLFSCWPCSSITRSRLVSTCRWPGRGCWRQVFCELSLFHGKGAAWAFFLEFVPSCPMPETYPKVGSPLIWRAFKRYGLVDISFGFRRRQELQRSGAMAPEAVGSHETASRKVSAGRPGVPEGGQGH